MLFRIIKSTHRISKKMYSCLLKCWTWETGQAGLLSQNQKSNGGLFLVQLLERLQSKSANLKSFAPLMQNSSFRWPSVLYLLLGIHFYVINQLWLLLLVNWRCWRPRLRPRLKKEYLPPSHMSLSACSVCTHVTMQKHCAHLIELFM